MEKHTVFMYWETKYNKDVNSPQFIYRVNQIPIKIPAGFVADKLILKFIWKGRSPRIIKVIFKKRRQWEKSLSQCKTFYTTT